jgi:lipoate-protein ligase B
MTGVLLDLGRVEYGSALELQRSLADRRSRDEIPDMLILLEHDHVITMGAKTTAANMVQQSIPVFRVERGGDATYHGPGQLVGYPIVKLDDHDVRRHMLTIENALISTARRWGVSGEIVEGRPGVWVNGRKLASVGVAVTNWVAYHGFALNVNTDMSYFDLIRPCGFDPATMTSMQQLLGRQVELGEVKKAVAEEYSAASREAFEPSEQARLAPADKH